MKPLTRLAMIIMTVSFLLTGCQPSVPSIVLATTTSTYDSGLLHYLLPKFESREGIRVEVISVGTGAALEIGRRGDCDVILVHSPAQEEAFVAAGFGSQRYGVMYNDYVYLGPRSASFLQTGGSLSTAVNGMIGYMTENDASFLSRGDSSGTHNMEQSLWLLAGIAEFSGQKWYLSLGQGMGDTLVAANEMRGFTLADRGTFLAMRMNLPNLDVVFSGDESLRNHYSIIPISPRKHAHVNHAAAMLLVEFLTSPEVQADLSQFGVSQFGEPLFFPSAKK